MCALDRVRQRYAYTDIHTEIYAHRSCFCCIFFLFSPYLSQTTSYGPIGLLQFVVPLCSSSAARESTQDLQHLSTHTHRHVHTRTHTYTQLKNNNFVNIFLTQSKNFSPKVLIIFLSVLKSFHLKISVGGLTWPDLD